MNYIPIHIKTIWPNSQIPFSVFIFFKQQYVHYVGPGADLAAEKLKKLKKQKIAKFFIQTDDEAKYQNYLDDILNQKISKSDLKSEEKVDLIQGAAHSALDSLSSNPMNQASFKMGQTVSRKIQELFLNDPNSLKELYGKSQDADSIIQHSTNVCALAVKLANEVKLPKTELDNLATAALIHDVGITSLNEETKAFFHRSKSELSLTQKNDYFKHCSNIVSLLRDRPYINQEVLDLIQYHEESRAGDGPYKKVKLSQSEEILGLVNLFDKKRIELKKPLPDICKSMILDDVGRYDLGLMQSLQKILKNEKLI